MIVNKKFGTRPFFVHGLGRLQFIPLWDEFFPPTRKFRVPDGVTVITFNNGGKGYNGKPLGALEQSLSGELVVLGQGLEDWKNKAKIQLLYDALPSVKSPYVLVSDSSDVIAIRNLHDIVAKFESFHCRALFNAEKNKAPADVADDIFEFEMQVAVDKEFPFLNAGLWIADTAFAKVLTTECLSAAQSSKHPGSEQFFYKPCYVRHHPDILLDHRCELFQSINRVGFEMIGFESLL